MVKHDFWPLHFAISVMFFNCDGILRSVFFGHPVCFSTAFVLLSYLVIFPLKCDTFCPQIYSFSNMIIRKVLMDRIVLWVFFFYFIFSFVSDFLFVLCILKRFKWINLSCTYIYVYIKHKYCSLFVWWLLFSPRILTDLLAFFLFHNVFYFVKNI